MSHGESVIAVLTAIYVLISFLTLGAIKREITLTHRPKVIVRNVVIRGLEDLGQQAGMNKWSADLTGYYFVANVGSSPATIRHVIDGAWVEKGLPMERPDRNNPGRKMSMRLAPGESREIDFEHIALTGDDALDLIEGKNAAYFIVRIRYADSRGLSRETGACRRFDPRAKQFVRVENPDYEYSD